MESATQPHFLEQVRSVSEVTKHMALLAKMQGRRGSGGTCLTKMGMVR